MPFEQMQGEAEGVEALTGFLVSTVLARNISSFVIRYCRLKRGYHRAFGDLLQQLRHSLPLFLIPRSMGARALWTLSGDLRGSKLVCRHDLREHKETHIVVERHTWGGGKSPYICIELLALLTLCRWCKGFNLADKPLQHCWLHPVSPLCLVTKHVLDVCTQSTIKLAPTRQFVRLKAYLAGGIMPTWWTGLADAPPEEAQALHALGLGFMAARTLHVALELRLFTHLAAGAQTLAQVAQSPGTGRAPCWTPAVRLCGAGARAGDGSCVS